MTGISSSTVAKMTNGEAVTLTVIEKICDKLDCKVEDVVEIKSTTIEKNRNEETAKVVNVVQKISEMMCKKYKTELNQDAQEFFLCSAEQGTIMNGNSTLQDNGITNGCRLFMV